MRVRSMFGKVGGFARRVAAAGAVLVAGVGVAAAQTTTGTGIDVSSVTSAFGNLDTALTTVGGLIIAAAALAVTYKWVKGMIFG